MRAFVSVGLLALVSGSGTGTGRTGPGGLSRRRLQDEDDDTAFRLGIEDVDYDDDDDDDDDDDFAGVPSPGLRRGPSLSMRAANLFRELKALQASEFECAVLKATRPDDHAAKEKHVGRLIETIQSFPRAASLNSDYYHMMLHKLWSRMMEPDWRSIGKALYIFHRMSVSLDPNLHVEFLQRYHRLRKLTHRKSRSTYYDVNAVVKRQPEGTPHARFLYNYAVFVFERFLAFNGDMEALQRVKEGRDVKEGNLLLLLQDARHVLDLAGRVKPGRAKTDHEITVQSSLLVAADCFLGDRTRPSLWDLFLDRLELLCEHQRQLMGQHGEEGAGLVAGPQGVSSNELEATHKLCTWALKAAPRFETHLATVASIARDYGEEVPRQLPGKNGAPGLLAAAANDITAHIQWMDARLGVKK